MMGSEHSLVRFLTTEGTESRAMGSSLYPTLLRGKTSKVTAGTGQNRHFNAELII
jgi:hypothetical protein